MSLEREERGRLDALRTPHLARAATLFIAMSGTANVVMQLARPGVGHGVKDSPVVGARLFDAPARRRETTLGFLAVAVHGTATERAAYRRAVNGSHAPVRSQPGETPVYTAFDPDLQLWVGACLFHAFEEAAEAVFGPLGEHREAFYQEGVIFGGMLQMPAARWPVTRGAFEDYWRAGLAAASIDDAVRAYLMRVIGKEYAEPYGRVTQRTRDRRLFRTTGFLPPEVRRAMELPWSETDAERFARSTHRVARVLRRTPEPLRGLPFHVVMRRIRRRLAAGGGPFPDWPD